MAELTLVLSDRTVTMPEKPVKCDRAVGVEWLRNWARENGNQPKAVEEANDGEAMRDVPLFPQTQ